jgi:HEAT repeat protein
MVLFDKGHRIFKVMRFEKSAQELIFQLTRAEEAMDRARAARELSAFKGEETVNALREVLLGDDFYGVRMAAAISLGEIGSGGARETLPDAKAALPTLMNAYRLSKDPHVRRACIYALGNFKDEETIDILGEALGKDESYYVAVAAARALAHIGGDKPYDILRASISRPSWQEVIAASIFHGFAQAKEKRAVDLAIDHGKYGARAPVRVAAIACLGALGKELNKEKKDDQVVDHLLELLKDKAVRARLGAVKALGKIGNKRALPPLREAQRTECLDMMKGALEDSIKSLEGKTQD